MNPYGETFVVIAGRARFFVSDVVIEAGAGEVVLGPAGVPRRFINLGPGRLQTIGIHHSTHWIQTDLDDGGRFPSSVDRSQALSSVHR